MADACSVCDDVNPDDSRTYKCVRCFCIICRNCLVEENEAVDLALHCIPVVDKYKDVLCNDCFGSIFTFSHSYERWQR